MYVISDGIYFLLYYVFGYRKKVVMHNLSIAFPEKNNAEKIRIAKDFYHGFVDNFIEAIKLFSCSKATISKRFQGNYEVINELKGSCQKVQLVSGHFFNWELGNLSISQINKFDHFIAVYMPIANAVFEKIMLNLRQKFGTTMLPAPKFKSVFQQYKNEEYVLVLVADQSPSNFHKAYWTPFFGKMTPFAPGPEKGAKANDTAVVFAHYFKIKRGYYGYNMELITKTPNEYKDGVLTKILVGKVEAAIKKIPSNYLWSHRRWKKPYDEKEFGHLVV